MRRFSIPLEQSGGDDPLQRIAPKSTRGTTPRDSRKSCEKIKGTGRLPLAARKDALSRYNLRTAMADIVIRPSMKFIKAGYAVTLLVIAAAVFVHYKYLADRYEVPWLPIVSLLLLIWPIKRHIHRQTIKLTIAGEKLRYETGLMSKSTRLIQLPKVQDVRVIQSVGQRMSGVGDLSIETAGESSRLVVENLDNPQHLAEEIIDMAGHAPASGVQ
jgi:membrane protein YdbS with pleckstrin-like domain